MEEIEALMLLKKKLGPASHWDGDLAGALVQALDLIPLAISRAATYIRERTPRSSAREVPPRISEERAREVPAFGAPVPVTLRRDGVSLNAVLTTWQISFDHIRSKRPSAADLLALMSFFGRQGIPESVLKARKTIPDATQASDRDTDGDIHSGFGDDVEMLRDYCLIAVNGAGDEFEMHGLVQLSMK